VYVCVCVCVFVCVCACMTPHTDTCVCVSLTPPSPLPLPSHQAPEADSRVAMATLRSFLTTQLHRVGGGREGEGGGDVINYFFSTITREPVAAASLAEVCVCVCE